jgi:hypothetical protein
MVGKHEGNRQLANPSLDDNIKMNLQEVGYGGMGWIELDQNRESCRALCECGNKPWVSIKCGEFLD